MDYSEYLKKRHPLSFFYRKYIVYPYYRSLLFGKCLEVGCGLGEFLEFSSGAKGIEINSKLIEICQQKGLDVSYGSAYEIPYPDKSFESVILDNVFEHLDEPEKCLKEIARVLKPNGRLLLSVPNKNGFYTDPTHVKYWDEKNLPALLTQLGFNPIKSHSFPIPYKDLGNLCWPYNCFICLSIRGYSE